jgi:hypothetical protein
VEGGGGRGGGGIQQKGRAVERDSVVPWGYRRGCRNWKAKRSHEPQPHGDWTAGAGKGAWFGEGGTSYGRLLYAACCLLQQVAHRLLSVACSIRPAACSLLSIAVACCLLHVVRCTLFVARCMLGTPTIDYARRVRSRPGTPRVNPYLLDTMYRHERSPGVDVEGMSAVPG